MFTPQMSAVLKLIQTALRETMKPSRLAIAAALVLGACGAPDNTAAQDEAVLAQPTRRAPVSDTEVKTSFAPVVQVASPAVVNISARALVRQRDPFWEFF